MVIAGVDLWVTLVSPVPLILCFSGSSHLGGVGVPGRVWCCVGWVGAWVFHNGKLSKQAIQKGPGVSYCIVRAGFTAPDLEQFCGLDQIGLRVRAQQIDAALAVLQCDLQVAPGEQFCSCCGAQGLKRGTLRRRFYHVPFGFRPTLLVVRLFRWRCQACGRVWSQDTTRIATARAKLTHDAIAWGLRALVGEHMSIARIAKALGVRWNTANKALLQAGRRKLVSDPARFDGVSVIGVDEHCWRHTRGTDKWVTVIIDLTAKSQNGGPARLLDMIPVRSKAVFKTWLASRPKQWRDKIRVVAMDGFTGFKTATSEALPLAETVLDPFHVVQIAGQHLSECRQRIQRKVHRRRGRKNDPLYQVRRLCLKSAHLLTDNQITRVQQVFDQDRYAPVYATWGIYQDVIQAYHQKDKKLGKFLMRKVINKIRA